MIGVEEVVSRMSVPLLRLTNSNAPRTIAVDQNPCSSCVRDVVQTLPPGSRVIVPSKASNPTGSPKTAARDAANGKVTALPRVAHKVPYKQRTSPPINISNNKD